MSVSDYTANFSFSLIDYATQGWHTREYANWRQLDGLLDNALVASIPFAVSTGAVNAYVVAFSPAITSLVEGQLISFQANLTNTGSATVNVNGLGAKNIFRDGAALVGGEIAILDYVRAIYDGTRFLLILPTNNKAIIDDGSIGYAKLSTGHPTWDVSSNLTIPGALAVAGFVKSFSDNLNFYHKDAAYASAEITYSTASPSGGANGDVWFKYTP